MTSHPDLSEKEPAQSPRISPGQILEAIAYGRMDYPRTWQSCRSGYISSGTAGFESLLTIQSAAGGILLEANILVGRDDTPPEDGHFADLVIGQDPGMQDYVRLPEPTGPRVIAALAQTATTLLFAPDSPLGNHQKLALRAALIP